MIFSFFSFDGDVFPLAYRLQEKGHEVLVCQIEDPNLLGTQTWITDKETPEVKRRRMSLFDGMLKKLSFSDMMVRMSKIVHKDYCFVMIGHNSLCKISERLLKMGFTTGLMPTTEDYEREKDRKKAKDFVRKYYSGIKVAESKEFSNVDEAVKFISESDKFWVVKSDGNFGETIVPDRDDLELAKQQVLGELKENKSAYNKGKLILEQKIMNAIEFSPQCVFFNGEPVYSHVEIETRMFGSGDIGDQTGGNENLIVRTEPKAKINEIAFPPAMREIAKKHKGMFIADAGILSDGKDLYFTEFCGCFSDDTEVLTENGWSTYKELVVGQKVLSISPTTEEMEWKPITNILVREHDGEMIRLKTIDALVTPDHKFWMSRNGKMKRFVASKLPLDGDWKIPRIGIWKGNNTPEITIPSFDVYVPARRVKKGTFMPHGKGMKDMRFNAGRGPREKSLSYGVKESNVRRFYRHTLPSLTFKTRDLCWLLGLWIAEGCFSGRAGKEPHGISIAQSINNQKRKEIESRLSSMGIRFRVQKNGTFDINNRNLTRYFHDDLGLQRTHANTKFIPKLFKEFSVEYLTELLMGYMLGDGYYNRRQWMCSTASKRLADDLQEIIHKIGWVSDIKFKRTAGTRFVINGRTYTRRHDSYIISTKHKKINTDTRSRNLAKEYYHGLVWDISVADNESLFVRRNGKAFFSSNCRFGWGGVFSEMSVSQANDGDIERYFQSVVYGENPLRYKYGGCIALYTIASDHKFPGLPQGDLPVFTKKGTEKEIFFSQVKMKTQEKEKRLVNIGYREYNGGPLAYVTGRGSTVQEVVDGIYKAVLGISLKGVYYRPSFDYLSTAYTSSIPNRLKFLEDKNLL